MRTRTLLLSLLAVFAFSAVVASAAMAAETEEEQQLICRNATGKCEEASKKGFKSTEGVSTLAVSEATVSCKKDTDTGKIVGKESFEKVVVTFDECKGNNTKTKTECEVKSKGAPHADEIITNDLKGELGEVTGTESSTGVGLLLEGESSNVFVTLEGSCLPVTPSAVEGSVVGEVTPLAKSLHDEDVFALNASNEQKIKTFERSLAKHCSGAPAARKCEEDFSFKPSLKAFGALSATFVSKDENTFEEELEVRAGV